MLQRADSLSSLILCDQTVETVSCVRYLETHTDDRESFTENVDFMLKEPSQIIVNQNSTF